LTPEAAAELQFWLNEITQVTNCQASVFGSPGKKKQHGKRDTNTEQPLNLVRNLLNL